MKKILLIEDDRVLNHTLKFNLEKEGYNVTSTNKLYRLSLFGFLLTILMVFGFLYYTTKAVLVIYVLFIMLFISIIWRVIFRKLLNISIENFTSDICGAIDGMLNESFDAQKIKLFGGVIF